MPDLMGYKGCKAIIRDEETGETIGESLIHQYERKTLTIGVDSKIFEKNHYDRVSLLILRENGIYEFRGNVRKSGAIGISEIALYHGRAMEHRTTKRYIVNTMAKIENLVIGSRLIPVLSFTDVLVENISTQGVLIRGNTGVLNLGTTFQLKLPIGGSDTVINSTVVRTHPMRDSSIEYGCRFNFLYSEG